MCACVFGFACVRACVRSHCRVWRFHALLVGRAILVRHIHAELDLADSTHPLPPRSFAHQARVSARTCVAPTTEPLRIACACGTPPRDRAPGSRSGMIVLDSCPKILPLRHRHVSNTCSLPSVSWRLPVLLYLTPTATSALGLATSTPGLAAHVLALLRDHKLRLCAEPELLLHAQSQSRRRVAGASKVPAQMWQGRHTQKDTRPV